MARSKVFKSMAVLFFLTCYVQRANLSITNAPKIIAQVTKRLSETTRQGHISNADRNPEMAMTSPEMIRNRGYPIEVHEVTTRDGYILQLHRIPYGRRSKNNRVKRKPVFLQHGHLGSSANWIFGPTNTSLAYLLADQGYDVWLGNTRGNFYSRKHTTLDAKDDQYWDFLWHEIGTYDIPTFINYVLNMTGHRRLSFVGYSYSCKDFFIGVSQQPELNRKVNVMIALGPAVRIGPSVRKIYPFMKHMPAFVHSINDIVNFWGGSLLKDILLENNFSEDRSAYNAYKHFITSVDYTRKQSATNNDAKTLQSYDYGESGNLQHYGTVHPINYNLKLVTVPTYVFYGENDLATPVEELEWLVSNLGNVKELYRVPDSKFTHMDFIATSAYDLVYMKILSIIPPAQ